MCLVNIIRMYEVYYSTNVKKNIESVKYVFYDTKLVIN